MPSSTILKFLIVGLGSMGKRRIRNLRFHDISQNNIFGFDLSTQRCDEVKTAYGIADTFNDFQEAIQAVNPDVYIISTPPDKHQEYFLRAATEKKHFFVEATTSVKGYRELFPLLGSDFVAAPSCTFRYFPGVLKIKSLLKSGAIGKPLSFNHYLGQYLPDWHPYEDYKKVYFAQKETGGCKEMFPYELVWLTDIFCSPVKNIQGLRGKISDLEITADDIYGALVQLESGVVGNLQIDILNRKACRTLKIIGNEGTLDWDWLDKKIEIYSVEKKSSEIIDLAEDKKVGQYNTGEDAYEAEMADFLQAVVGEKNFPYTFAEDEKILQCLNNFTEIK